MSDEHTSNWGPSPHRLLSLTEAWEIIASEVRPLAPVVVPFRQAAGRVLADPIIASGDYPAFDKAQMDGFAVRSVDCGQLGVSLTIVDTIAAGQTRAATVNTGQAARINTGAPLPAGADAVVPIERTSISTDGKQVTINVVVTAGKHVARRGMDRHRGDIILAPPTRLGPAQLAAAAAAGAEHLAVRPEVTAAIVMTGDELVPVGSKRQPGQIFESNGPMLVSLVNQFGGHPEDLGIVRDDPNGLSDAFTRALQHPVVITAGGMSMGTLDLVPKLFIELGVKWLFHGVNMRPGKPVAYGRGPEGQHVFGLPGNPVSSFVCAWLFVRAAIRGLAGFPPLPPHRLRAELTHALPAAKDPRSSFTPAVVWNDDVEGLMVEPCAWSGSGDPFGLALANCLLIREQPTQPMEAGSSVEIIYTALEMP